jgi:hypothetical protein
LGRDRLPDSVRAAFRPALSPLRALRAAHSGYVADSIMWFTVGVAAFGGLAVITIR